MALSNLFHHGAVGQRKLCRFEIRLENEYVFLRGNERETGPFQVKGSVVLMTSESISTKSINIKLQGNLRTTHWWSSERERPMGFSSTTPIINRRLLYEEKCELGEEHVSRVLKPGNYEFPFEFTMPGNTPGTIEGLMTSYVTYGFKATVDRGVLAKDLVARKPLRIIRSLGDDPLEIVDPQDVSGLWPDKIKYQFSTASRAAIYGTHITTDIELIPLLDKLRVGEIRAQLRETSKIKTIPGPLDMSVGDNDGMWKREMVVKEMAMEVPPDSDDVDPELQLPMLKFRIQFDLPKSLTQCRQSVGDNEWIRIKHSLHYSVQLLNPDGHLSALQVHHPMHLFISPNLPIGDNNSVGERLTSVDATSNAMDDMRNAPPDYSHHRLDPLYDGVTASGFMTPGVLTGANTPGMAPSRRGSHDGQPSLATVANAEGSLHEELHRRLGLLEHGSDTDASHGGHAGHMSPSDGHSSSGPSRSNSHYELAALANRSSSATAADYDMDALRQVPSYDTAVRTPVWTPLAEVPPNFDGTGSAMAHSPETGHGRPSAAALARQTPAAGLVRH